MLSLSFLTKEENNMIFDNELQMITEDNIIKSNNKNINTNSKNKK